jgi:hypothetical protein
MGSLGPTVLPQLRRYACISEAYKKDFTIHRRKGLSIPRKTSLHIVQVDNFISGWRRSFGIEKKKDRKKKLSRPKYLFEFKAFRSTRGQGQVGRMLHAGTGADRARMSAEEETQYDVAHECIGKYRGVILELGRKLKAVGPKPVAGSCARLYGGMGSTHGGGTRCLWDAHDPTKPSGNVLALCRWSHVHWDPRMEPNQAFIDAAIVASTAGARWRSEL